MHFIMRLLVHHTIPMIIGIGIIMELIFIKFSKGARFYEQGKRY